MTTQRLNQDNRRTIVDCGVAFIVGDQRKELKDKGTILIQALRAIHYSPAVLAIIDNLPSSFVSECDNVKIHIDTPDEKRTSYSVTSSAGVKFGYNEARNERTTVQLFTDEPRHKLLVEAVIDYDAAKTKLKNTENKFTAMARQVVNKQRTVKGLLEAWPECQYFLPVVLSVPPKLDMLPAEITNTLSDMIGHASARRKAEAELTEA